MGVGGRGSDPGGDWGSDCGGDSGVDVVVIGERAWGWWLGRVIGGVYSRGCIWDVTFSTSTSRRSVKELLASLGCISVREIRGGGGGGGGGG